MHLLILRIIGHIVLRVVVVIGTVFFVNKVDDFFTRRRFKTVLYANLLHNENVPKEELLTRPNMSKTLVEKAEKYIQELVDHGLNHNQITMLLEKELRGK